MFGLITHFLIQNVPKHAFQIVAFQHCQRVFQVAVVIFLLINVLGNQAEQNLFRFCGFYASDDRNHLLIKRSFVFLFSDQAF
ncbi:Uncharacterised protein [Klebsiella pneumoniae]|nr:Uncharacterised protein [Klebsiella pneumoniae]